MILPSDILLRKTSDGTTVWVSQRLVVEMCGISDYYLRDNCRVRYKQTLPASWRPAATGGEFWLGDSGKSWRWGRRGGQYYYDWDRIPNRRPCLYRDMLPGKDELIRLVEEHNSQYSRERKASLRAALTAAADRLTDNEDARWIQTRSGDQISVALCRDYARALGWCRMILDAVRSGRFAEYGAPSTGAFYDQCAEALGRLRLSNFRLSTGESLRKKLAGFPPEADAQRRWIISGKIGNNNRTIVGKYPVVDHQTGEIYRFDVHQSVMYMVYANIGQPQKESMAALYRDQYLPAMAEFDEIPMAERTFRQKLSTLPSRLRFDLFRHGEDYYKKHYLTYIPTEELTWAHSLFCGDGSGLISYRYTSREYNRKTRRHEYKTRTRNLYVVMITDVASGYIAGYSIAPEGSSDETFDLIQEAVRMAVDAGGRQTMFEFVSDNASGFSKADSREWLSGVFSRVRRIEAHNSQANPAEKYFRLFKNIVLRSVPEFVRSSHEVSIRGRANTDDMSVFDYPTYDEAIPVLRECIRKWNNRDLGDGQTPASRFRAKNPWCRPMDSAQLRRIFGTSTLMSIERMRGFVTPQGAAATCMYEIPDYVASGAEIISRATGGGYDSRVEVVYDAAGADLYSIDGRFIMTCPPVEKASMSYIEATPQQKAAREHLRTRKAADMDAVWQTADELQRTADYMFDYGYQEAAHFGLMKSDINEGFETRLSLTSEDKRDNNRKIYALKQKEEREAAERQAARQMERQERYMERHRRIFREYQQTIK